MEPKRWRTLSIAGVGTSLLLLVLALVVDTDPLAAALSIAGLAVFCLASLSGLIFWRCPSCRRLLPVQGSLGMEHCPYCSTGLH